VFFGNCRRPCKCQVADKVVKRIEVALGKYLRGGNCFQDVSIPTELNHQNDSYPGSFTLFLLVFFWLS